MRMYAKVVIVLHGTECERRGRKGERKTRPDYDNNRRCLKWFNFNSFHNGIGLHSCIWESAIKLHYRVTISFHPAYTASKAFFCLVSFLSFYGRFSLNMEDHKLWNMYFLKKSGCMCNGAHIKWILWVKNYFRWKISLEAFKKVILKFCRKSQWRIFHLKNLRGFIKF